MHFTPLKPSEIPILCHGQEAVVRIPNRAILESPIELGLEASDSDSPISLKIHAGKWSSATVIVRLEGGAEVKSLDYKQIVVAEEGSQVRIVEFQNLSPSTKFTAQRETDAEKRASIEHILIELGAHSTDGNLSQKTQGAEATLDSSIFLMAKQSQRHHFLLNNNFVHKDGRGESVVRSIAMGDGVIDTRGTINVGGKAKGAESHLHLDSLLLSRMASITAVPALEINTNDVKVGHGASVSNLNEENLFYLTSRGLNPDEARKLMVRGFVSEVTDRLNDLPELQEKILELI